MNAASSLRLASISTLWTQWGVARADECVATRNRLLLRYAGAVRRYLGAVTRDDALADELTQQFCLKFLRGDFDGARADRGRFRDYLKRALANLVTDDHRARRIATALPNEDCLGTRASPATSANAETAFTDAWRHTLLDRAAERLRNERPLLFAVLQIELANPDEVSREKAQTASRELGQRVTATRFRVCLKRARDHLTRLLREEIAATLTDPTPAAVEEELRRLRLTRYCAQR